jgi:hypothetical protein
LRKLLVPGALAPDVGPASARRAEWAGSTRARSARSTTAPIGVFLGYAVSGTGHTLLDRRLYLQEDWFTPEMPKVRLRQPFGLP